MIRVRLLVWVLGLFLLRFMGAALVQDCHGDVMHMSMRCMIHTYVIYQGLANIT